MSSSFFTLVRVQLMNQFKVNNLRSSADKKAKRTAILMLVVFAFLGVMLAVYSFGLGFGLGYLGLANIIPAFAITIASLITLIFTFFKTNGVLFGFRDYDLLASLPISAGALISSRFFTMFVMNTASAAVLMIPMCVAHFIFVPPTAVSVVFWVVGILISSLIPTTVAAFFGAIVMYISSRFKRSNAVSVILTFVLIVAVMYASFSGSVGSAQMTMSDFARLSSDVYNKLCGIYPVARLFNDAIVAHDVLAFALFLALSVLWYALFVRLVSLRYNAINSAHTARAALGNYKLKSLDIRSPLHALYKKEWKRFVGSPVYITNIGCGVIMAIILIAACMVFEPIKLEAMLNSPGLADIYMKILPFALAMILSMSCTTSCALSLEGKNLWILRTSPLPAKTVYDSKILVNLTILLPVAVVGSVLLSVRLHADFTTALVFFTVPVVFSAFTSVFGMFVNCKLPNFDWESETAVVKQSAASMLGILGTPFIIIVFASFLFIFPSVDSRIISASIAAVAGLISYFMYRRVVRIPL